MKNYLPAGATLWTLYIKRKPLLLIGSKGFLNIPNSLASKIERITIYLYKICIIQQKRNINNMKLFDLQFCDLSK